MKYIRKNIPNAFTMINLSLGFVAILINDPLISPLLILAAGAADLLDGYLARKLKAYTLLGKQLDSLADLVSFGVAPAFLYYGYFLDQNIYGMLFAALLPVFCAIRLGIYNIDESQKDHFRGLPTPATGLFFAFMVFAKEKLWFDVFPDWVFYFLVIAFAGMMVAPFNMLSIKNFENKHVAEKTIIVVFIATSLLVLLAVQIAGVPAMVILYIVSSVMWYFAKPRINQF